MALPTLALGLRVFIDTVQPPVAQHLKDKEVISCIVDLLVVKSGDPPDAKVQIKEAMPKLAAMDPEIIERILNHKSLVQGYLAKDLRKLLPGGGTPTHAFTPSRTPFRTPFRTPKGRKQAFPTLNFT